MRVLYFSFLSFFLVFTTQCKFGARPPADKILAKVFNKTLYLSNLDGMFPENATLDDSASVVNTFSDRWIRDQVLMNEAEKHVPSDLNIDELIKKYRESLILSNYEESLIKQNLDTTIAESELTEFYERNKDQYQLSAPILRCYLLKIPKPITLPDSLQKWWNTPKAGTNLLKLRDYAKKFARAYILDDSTWHRVDDVSKYFPKGTVTPENVARDKEITLKDNDFQYYFRILGVLNQKEIAPLSFIRQQASKYILHQRKQKLLEQKQQEMYEAELKKNNIKIYKLNS